MRAGALRQTLHAALHAGLHAALLAAGFLALQGCGYVQGYSAQSLGVRTVAIRAVANETLLQGIDQQLSVRLGQDLTPMTGLVPARWSAADAVLEVSFLQAGGQALIAGGQGSQQEGSVWFECQAVLRDRSTGRVLHESKHADRAEYRLAVGESRRSAYDEAVADLSRKILISLGQNKQDHEEAPLDPRERRRRDLAPTETPEPRDPGPSQQRG